MACRLPNERRRQDRWSLFAGSAAPLNIAGRGSCRTAEPNLMRWTHQEDAMEQPFTDILIRIRKGTRSGYPVEAWLSDGSF